MAITNPGLTGLQQAFNRRTTHAQLLNSDDWLKDAFDKRVQGNRANEDAYQTGVLSDASNPEFGNAIQAEGAQVFNRAREDAATGGAGYNRAWVPFIEEPDALAQATGMKVRVDPRGLRSLPSVERPLLSAPPDEQVGGMRSPYGTMSGRLAELSQAPQKSMPESQDAFMARMARKFGKR